MRRERTLSFSTVRLFQSSLELHPAPPAPLPQGTAKREVLPGGGEGQPEDDATIDPELRPEGLRIGRIPTQPPLLHRPTRPHPGNTAAGPWGTAPSPCAFFRTRKVVTTCLILLMVTCSASFGACRVLALASRVLRLVLCCWCQRAKKFQRNTQQTGAGGLLLLDLLLASALLLAPALLRLYLEG